MFYGRCRFRCGRDNLVLLTLSFYFCSFSLCGCRQSEIHELIGNRNTDPQQQGRFTTRRRRRIVWKKAAGNTRINWQREHGPPSTKHPKILYYSRHPYKRRFTTRRRRRRRYLPRRTRTKNAKKGTTKEAGNNGGTKKTNSTPP